MGVGFFLATAFLGAALLLLIRNGLPFTVLPRLVDARPAKILSPVLPSLDMADLMADLGVGFLRTGCTAGLRRVGGFGLTGLGVGLGLDTGLGFLTGR